MSTPNTTSSLSSSRPLIVIDSLPYSLAANTTIQSPPATNSSPPPLHSASIPCSSSSTNRKIKFPVQYYISPRSVTPHKKVSTPFYNRPNKNNTNNPILKCSSKSSSNSSLEPVKFSYYPFDRECSDTDLINPRFSIRQVN